MFTGIVQAVGRIAEVKPAGQSAAVTVDAGGLDLGDVAIGDSIACNGVCLTVTRLVPKGFAVDVSQETLRVSAGFSPGAAVNLEKSLRLADRLGGHLVSGHVDGTGEVVAVNPVDGNRELTIRFPRELARYFARKGSASVNGVSLTVNSIAADSFSVNLIPHTLAVTSMNELKRGDRVNLEVDLVARYVERMLGEGGAMSTVISNIQDIIADIKAGRMVVLVDEEDRENEGDILMAAEFVTADAVNFMAKHGRGLICLTLTEERCRQLALPLMVGENRSRMGTNFTLSIEAAQGVTTGISAADRARTVQAAVRKDAKPDDVVQPGHIFPLMAQPGGVLVRAGHTEAGCDLAQLAGLTPAAVICEVLKDDGEMARLPDLMEFAATHQLKIGTIADLIHYRSRTESLVERAAERDIETVHGSFRLVAYRDKSSRDTHIALVKGEVSPGRETLVRVHEPLSVADFLDAGGRSHSWNLNEALRTVAAAGSGVVVLLHRTESGAELLDRLQMDAGAQPQKVDLRTYGIGAQILRDLGVTRMKLLATPRKMPSMTGFDLEVTGYLQPQKKP